MLLYVRGGTIRGSIQPCSIFITARGNGTCKTHAIFVGRQKTDKKCGVGRAGKRTLRQDMSWFYPSFSSYKDYSVVLDPFLCGMRPGGRPGRTGLSSNWSKIRSMRKSEIVSSRTVMGTIHFVAGGKKDRSGACLVVWMQILRGKKLWKTKQRRRDPCCYTAYRSRCPSDVLTFITIFLSAAQRDKHSLSVLGAARALVISTRTHAGE